MGKERTSEEGREIGKEKWKKDVMGKLEFKSLEVLMFKVTIIDLKYVYSSFLIILLLK